MFQAALLMLALATGGGAADLDRFLGLVSGFWAGGQGEAGNHLDPDGAPAAGDAGGHLDPDGAVDNNDAGGHFDPNS